MRGLLSLVIFTSACHVTASGGGVGPQLDAPGGDPGADASGQVDASPPDAPAMFGTPMPLAPGNTGAAEDDGTIAWNGNELVFARVDSASTKHLYYASRTDPTQPFGAATLLSHASPSGNQDESPRFSNDDLTLYFGSNRTPNSGGTDIWMMTRASIGGAWNLPTKVTALSTGVTEKWVATCSTGYFLMVRDDGTANGTDVYDGMNLANPTRVAELSSVKGETGTYLSPDCLTAYFASTRDGTNDLWMSTRATTADLWNAPAKVAFSTDTLAEQDPWMSADQRTFIFASNATGGGDLYITTR